MIDQIALQRLAVRAETLAAEAQEQGEDAAASDYFRLADAADEFSAAMMVLFVRVETDLLAAFGVVEVG